MAGVHNLHGMPGIVGAIAGAFSALAASENEVFGQKVSTIFPAREDETAGWWLGGGAYFTFLFWHRFWLVI